MKKWPLAKIMESKFKKLVLIFFIFFTAMIIIGSFLLYNHFYESAKKDVYNDINFYFMELDNNFSAIENRVNKIFQEELNSNIEIDDLNLMIKEQLNYLLSDKSTNISLYTEGYTSYFNEGENLNDSEKIIFENSINQNKTIEKNDGLFSKSYYRGWKNNYGNRFVKVEVKYSLYKNAFYILFLIFIFVLGFQLFLRYSFKEIIASVTGPIKNLTEKMNEFKIRENMDFNLEASQIKEINDIQDNFKDMTDEINANYEQLEAYNSEIINKNERLNNINKALDKNKRKYKNLFNNMLNGFAYYKILYNDKMEAIDCQLIEANEAFENYFPIPKDILLEKYDKIVKGKKENFQFEKYFKDEDKWLNINIFSTYKGYLAAVISDITELKKSKKESEKLSSNLEKIISLTSVLADKDLGENKFSQKLLKTAVEVIPEADYDTVYKNKDGKVKFIDTIGHEYKKLNSYSKRLLKSLNNISTSFYKMRKYNKLQNEFTKELILSIVRMLEIHDLYTRGHSEKVAKLSKMLAKHSKICSLPS